MWAESLFDNQISSVTCCGRHRVLHQPSLRMKLSCRQTETCVEKEAGVCTSNYLPVSNPLTCWLLNYLLNKPHDAHLHAHAKTRTHILTMLWYPLLLPSVSFFFCLSPFPESWFMFGLGVSMSALICLPFVVFLRPLFPSRILQYRGGKETFWTPLYFMIWLNPKGRKRERERDGEVERWGTQGPVWTRRHCVAPQLCRTDSLHYSTLQQPAPESSANLLLNGPSS